MLANLITATRVVLVIVAAILLLHGASVTSKALAAALIAVSLVLDAVDGVVARRLGQASRAGEVIDIGADRIVELTLWVTFAQLGLVSVWVAVIVLARGIATDAIRSVALAEGRTAFGEHSMVRTPLGRFLVTSRFSRGLYGVVKMLAFCWTAALAAVAAPAAASTALWTVKDILVWTTVGLCLIRGVPVIGAGVALLRGQGTGAPTPRTEPRPLAPSRAMRRRRGLSSRAVFRIAGRGPGS